MPSPNSAQGSIALKSKLLKQGGVGAFLRLFSLVSGFLIAIFLARILGAEGLGIYASALAVLTLLTLPTEFGLPTLIIREVAKKFSHDGNREITGLLYFSLGLLGTSFLPLAMLGFFIVTISPWGELIQAHKYWWLVLLYIFFTGLGAVFSAFLAGSKSLILAQFPSLVLKPVLLLIAILLLQFGLHEELTPVTVLLLQTFSVICAALFSGVLLLGKFFSVFRSARPTFRVTKWLISAWKLGLVNAVRRGQPQLLIYLLSLLSTPESVGFLRICQRGASIVSFGTSVVTTTSMPYVSSLLKESHERLQQLLSRSAMLMSSWALVCLLIIIVFGAQLLELVFGPEFRVAYMVLVIFCAVEFIKAYFGMSMVVLNMSGHEEEVLKIMLVGMALSLAGTFILAPQYASLGCAVAFAFSTLFMYWKANSQTKVLLRLDAGFKIANRRNG